MGALTRALRRSPSCVAGQRRTEGSARGQPLAKPNDENPNSSLFLHSPQLASARAGGPPVAARSHTVQVVATAKSMLIFSSQVAELACFLQTFSYAFVTVE